METKDVSGVIVSLLSPNEPYGVAADNDGIKVVVQPDGAGEFRSRVFNEENLIFLENYGSQEEAITEAVRNFKNHQHRSK